VNGGKDLDITNALYEYPYIDDEVKKLNNKLRWIISNKYETKVTASNSLTPRGKGISDPVYNAVEKIVEKYDIEILEIGEEINALLKWQNELGAELKKLSHDQLQVIELRYFKKMGWDAVSRKMIYSTRQCHRKRDAALKKLRSGLGGDWN
jgi:hypothetical protein